MTAQTTTSAADRRGWASPEQRARTWRLHVAATPADVTAILAELGLTMPVHDFGSEQFPACLSADGGPYGPPSWLGCVRAELTRRGNRTSYCSDQCPLHTVARVAVATVSAEGRHTI